MSNENVAIAFALVIGAGLSTALGASVVFIPSLVKLANRKTLAGALGISAGVMLYVSFVEIFVKSRISFVEAGHGDGGAAVYSTVCFFGGVFLMMILQNLVSALTGGHHHGHHHNHQHKHKGADKEEESSDSSAASFVSDLEQPKFICCSEDPAGDLENVQHMGQEIEESTKQGAHWEGYHSEREASEAVDEEATAPSDSDDALVVDPEEQRVASRKLLLTSINTALAIALHNFPEGLATFVAALDDPSVGAVLAAAIAIHNIPEGLCVALPVYYATGNRWKAFSWAMLSGVAEPFAALLGWAVLANSFSYTLYGALFGLVAGMMVIISVKELLPTAQRYDPEDSVATVCFIVGMAVMALSLILFVA